MNLINTTRNDIVIMDNNSILTCYPAAVGKNVIKIHVEKAL